MSKFKISVNSISTVFFGLAVYVFFVVFYQYHLHYQEQLQMFLFTSEYFGELMSRPGGLADYIGTFLTQFYYFSWAGAIIIALLLVGLQQLVAKLSAKLSSNSLFYPLTFIPSMLLWALLCDENFLLSAVVSILLILLSVRFFLLIKNPDLRVIVSLLLLPVLYWFAGGVFWVFAVFCVLFEWKYFKQFSLWQWGFLLAGSLLLLFLTPVFAKSYLHYPLSRLWWGISYYRYPVVSPYPLLAVWLSVVLIPFLLIFAPTGLKKIAKLLVTFFQMVLFIVFCYYSLHFSADLNKEEIMAYDYNARIQNWDEIIKMANQKDPVSPLSVACLNLALNKTGTMGDAMFRYFQNGPEGLLPGFQRDFTSPFISGEIYYHLGLINTSMQFAFEAMEAIPDYKKSSRAIKRMAEVNLLNQEYGVATKYLNLLCNTLFYNEWATETLRCIKDEKLIEQNIEWSTLRKYRLTEDFLSSEDEKDQMLGLLFVHCPENKMAYEYLMAYTLLTKDLNHFVQYFPLGKNLGYKVIPAHYQEALLYFWAATHEGNLTQLPWSMLPSVQQYFQSYININASGKGAEPTIKKSFSQTYWYYLDYRK